MKTSIISYELDTGRLVQLAMTFTFKKIEKQDAT